VKVIQAETDKIPFQESVEIFYYKISALTGMNTVASN
jgi:hypothetical protein